MKGAAPAVALAALIGCSGGGGAPDPGGGTGTVAGTINGVKWASVPSAYWIGKPGAGSPPVILFMLESPTSCSSLSLLNWDKIIGTEQVLEIGVSRAATGAFRVPGQASVAYLRGDFNPSADGGTVTLGALTTGKSLSGSFDVTFGTDAYRGTFEAIYCPAGVEP